MKHAEEMRPPDVGDVVDELAERAPKNVLFSHYWDAEFERISLISVIPTGMHNHSSPSTLWGDDEYYEAWPTHLRDDILIGERAAAFVRDAFEATGPFLMMVSFAYGAMANRKGRQRIWSFFERLDARLRPYFVLRIVRVPPGLPSATLIDTVSYARTLTRQICIQATPHMLSKDYLRWCGAGLISLNVSRLRPPGASRPSEASVRNYLQQCRRHARYVMADGISNAAELELCISSGVRFLAGPGLVKPMEGIIGPVSIPRNEVFSRIVLV